MFVLKQTLPFDIFVDLDVMFMYRKIAQHSNKELKIRQIFAWYKVTSACHCACHRVRAHGCACVRLCPLPVVFHVFLLGITFLVNSTVLPERCANARIYVLIWVSYIQ